MSSDPQPVMARIRSSMFGGWCSHRVPPSAVDRCAARRNVLSPLQSQKVTAARSTSMARTPSRRHRSRDTRTNSADSRSISPVRVISARVLKSWRWTVSCGRGMAPRFGRQSGSGCGGAGVPAPWARSRRGRTFGGGRATAGPTACAAGQRINPVPSRDAPGDRRGVRTPQQSAFSNCMPPGSRTSVQQTSPRVVPMDGSKPPDPRMWTVQKHGTRVCPRHYAALMNARRDGRGPPEPGTPRTARSPGRAQRPLR